MKIRPTKTNAQWSKELVSLWQHIVSLEEKFLKQDEIIKRMTDLENHIAWRSKQAEANGELKLYVWEEVLENHSYGIMFALARTVEEARILIRKDNKEYMVSSEDLEKEPRVIETPEAFVMQGSN